MAWGVECGVLVWDDVWLVGVRSVGDVDVVSRGGVCEVAPVIVPGDIIRCCQPKRPCLLSEGGLG